MNVQHVDVCCCRRRRRRLYIDLFIKQKRRISNQPFIPRVPRAS